MKILTLIQLAVATLFISPSDTSSTKKHIISDKQLEKDLKELRQLRDSIKKDLFKISIERVNR